MLRVSLIILERKKCCFSNLTYFSQAETNSPPSCPSYSSQARPGTAFAPQPFVSSTWNCNHRNLCVSSVFSIADRACTVWSLWPPRDPEKGALSTQKLALFLTRSIYLMIEGEPTEKKAEQCFDKFELFALMHFLNLVDVLHTGCVEVALCHVHRGIGLIITKKINKQ